ncbi:MAG: hypothetical protein J6386_00790 [Candidatus Synoicihabitans palmerolidicus]|nr:hypothetical protein [Candidatus Synoicihabitans palmerolidicus]
MLRVMQESSRIVAGGLPLLEVDDPTDLEVRIEVLSRDGVAITPGASVWLDQWGAAPPRSKLECASLNRPPSPKYPFSASRSNGAMC